MDRNALDWIFSTAPQAIAALVGLIGAGISLLYAKLDGRKDADPTFNEIVKEIKKRIYKRLKRLLTWALIAVFVDLVCLCLNPIENNRILSLSRKFSPYFTFAFLVFVYNLWVLYLTVRFIMITMNPSFEDNTINSLANNYNKQEVDKTDTVELSEFIQHFIEFEKLLRQSDLFFDRKDNYQRSLSLIQMVRELLNLKLIDKGEYNIIREINRVRNLALHGGDIQVIDKVTDDRLVEITKKLKGKLSPTKEN